MNCSESCEISQGQPHVADLQAMRLDWRIKLFLRHKRRFIGALVDTRRETKP
jgi:hypothetical protein